jgi:Ca-activated chloride channel family protein
MRQKARIPGKRPLALALLLGLLLAAAADAQEFKIRAKVDLVVTPVTVKSSGDKLVTGLTKDDFIILEDGRPQLITNFTADPAPLSAVVLIDTGLGTASFAKIKKTFTALAEAFSEFDEVAVYRYDKFVSKVLDFSQNAEQIQAAINTIRDIKPDENLEANLPSGPFVPGPMINGAPVIPPGQIGIFVTLPKRPARVLHDAVFAAAQDLGGRSRDRRKIVLLISDGQSSGNDHSSDQTKQSLLEKGIEVYAVGLDQPFPYKSVSILEEYAKTTGGDVYFAGAVQDIEAAYSAVTEEARNQYVLGYVSNNEVIGPGPVFRDIEVLVEGRNLKTLHRKGYYQYP